MSSFLTAGRLVLARRRAVWLCAILALSCNALAQAANPVVESSTREAVTFSLSLEAPTWRAGLSGVAGQDVWEARVPGCISTASPGQPILPRRAVSLVVPPGTRPVLEVLQESWLDLDGRLLAREPLSTLVQDPVTGDVFERPIIIQPGDELPSTGVPSTVLADYLDPDLAPLSGPAVRMNDPHWWRGRRVVNLVLMPVRADASGHAERALESGRWRVRFVADAGADKAAPARSLQRLSGKGDQHFAGHFLNGDIMTGLPTEAVHRGTAFAGKTRAADKGTPLGYAEVRLPVNRSQLYRVRYSQLVSQDLLPDGVAVDEAQIRVYQRRYLDDFDNPADDLARPYLEVEVPIHMVGEGDRFDDDDLFLFWGLRPSDDTAFSVDVDGTTHELDHAGDLQEISNEHNVYWLQLSEPDAGETWARMAEAGMPASSGSPQSSYQRIDRFDEAVAYRENVPSINSDRYYYNTHLAPDVEVPLNLWSPVAGQPGALLRVGMGNFSTSGRTMVMELMDGETAHSTLPPFELLGNLYERVYSEILPGDALTVPGIALRVSNQNAALRVFSYLDWVEVDYRAEYSAPFGRLAFPGGDSGVTDSDLEIDGFPADDELGLIEVTDPRNPVFVALTRSNLLEEGGGTTLSLNVDQTHGQRRFYAATRMFSNGVPDVDYAEASTADDDGPPTQLTGSGADVLVVAPDDFAAGVASWIQYRQSRDPDLTIHVADPQSLYDWYSGGLKNPWAIKRLVNHALESPNWGTWALVLMGDANENPRELGVLSDGRQWSRDWVPTHFHIQDASGLSPEVLGSDEWFGNPYAHDGNFPASSDITDMASVYVGRIPCHSDEDLARVLTKIQQVESSQGEAWRRRGIFMSDDAWSSGTLDAGGYNIAYHPSETAFEQSENDSLARDWANNAGMVSMVVDTVMLRPFMEPLHPNLDDVVGWSEAREFCEESDATETLAGALSAGGTLAHYQGHANHFLMAHESWFVDNRRDGGYRTDIDLLTNTGRPWLFCGMGCHLGDYVQNVGSPNGSTDPGLGEKFLLWLDGGSVASYASSGYEYLTQNQDLSEGFLRTMMHNPPIVTVDGGETRTRWMLGELMWKAERDLLAANAGNTVRAMVYQYVILGDPLLMLDAGEPVIEAAMDGSGPLQAETELTAVDATGVRVITMQARDEAGIDRLLVRDSTGADLTAQAVEVTPYYDDGRTQVMDYVITLPVRPFPHDITIDVYDTADRLDSDLHPSFTLSVAHESDATFMADGEPVDPIQDVYQPGEPVDISVSITSAAWLDQETEVTVEGDNLEVSGVNATVQDSDHLVAEFTVTAPTAGKANRGVRLLVEGYETYIELESSDVEPAAGGVTGLVNFPNPMREATRFVFGTNVLSGTGKLRVWTVAGHSVAEVPFTLAGGGEEMVSWNGLDREGDELANGTYLYRVELQGPVGQVRSDMHRLVIMR